MSAFGPKRMHLLINARLTETIEINLIEILKHYANHFLKSVAVPCRSEKQPVSFFEAAFFFGTVPVGRLSCNRRSRMPSTLNDPEFWQWRANAARMLAEEFEDDEDKAAMLRVASEYDNLAVRHLSKPVTSSSGKVR
jgi:hypothetical protein